MRVRVCGVHGQRFQGCVAWAGSWGAQCMGRGRGVHCMGRGLRGVLLGKGFEGCTAWAGVGECRLLRDAETP